MARSPRHLEHLFDFDGHIDAVALLPPSEQAHEANICQKQNSQSRHCRRKHHPCHADCFVDAHLSPIRSISVGPTVHFTAVHRFAAFLLLAGPPRRLSVGPNSSSLRYTASRPSYFWPVPPRRLSVGPNSSSLRYTASRPSYFWPVPHAA